MPKNILELAPPPLFPLFCSLLHVCEYIFSLDLFVVDKILLSAFEI